MDTIRGRAYNVVDGDTFDMTVTFEMPGNSYAYNNQERIRIETIDAPEAGQIGGDTATQRLENRIWNRQVEVSVSSRDTYGRVVGSVRVI